MWSSSLRPAPRSLTHLACGWALLASTLALAGDPVRFDEHDVKTVFAIGKSDDGNQVQYALRLDASCLPMGKEPVFGYWREYDHHERLFPLGWLDQFGYGISKQKVKGARVVMTIKPASNREIELVASKSPDGGCKADAYTALNGRRAKLTLIYLTLSGPISVSKVELRGSDPETGLAVSEVVKL